MRIAYLILCHKNPEQVQMLIKKLDNKNTDFYIHIDKKAENFLLSNSGNIFLVPDKKRIDVQWATNSMIIATFEVIHLMLDSKRKYDYVFLISGQDFPIKSNEEIDSFLTENQGTNFIEILPHSSEYYKRYMKRNDIFYPKCIQKPTIFAKVLKKFYIYLSGGYNHTFNIFKRKNNNKLSFEFGSQWWCLTYDCLVWINNYVIAHKNILDFFEYALTPDECIFQTLFMISPYKEKRQDKLTYLEWDKNKNNPRIFTKEDFSLLKRSKCFFARKFDTTIDKEIVDLLLKN